MIHKIMVLFQTADRGKPERKRRAATPGGYIITASLRRQWEPRRGNCAL
jgi:hypothetical protein